MTTGSLSIVGTGIRPSQHITPESAQCIENSDSLLYLIPDQSAAQYVIELAGGDTFDAGTCYQSNMPLAQAYDSMIETAMQSLRAGRRTCFALYGHPGVIVYPSHRLLRQARSEGYAAKMLPGISAEDCLFADLGIDPASQGCQSFWATDLLLNRRQLDPTMALIAWSIGVAGCFSYSDSGMSDKALLSLLQRLYAAYAPTHPVVVYEAATVVGESPRADVMPLGMLPSVPLDGASTLYIPPALPTVPDWSQYEAMSFPPEAVGSLFQAQPPIVDHR